MLNIKIQLKGIRVMGNSTKNLFQHPSIPTEIYKFFMKGVEDPNVPTDKPIKNDEKEREDLSVEKTKKIMSAKKARKPPAR